MKMPTMEFGLKGLFRLVVSKGPSMQDVVHDTGLFNNLITDVGMHRIGSLNSNPNNSQAMFASLCGRIVVGAGNAPPAVTDTALQSFIAMAASAVPYSQTSSDALGYSRILATYEFAPGEATGNISEVGVQHTNAEGPLWSRALVLDADGFPTTITVRPSDFLTVIYELRIYHPPADVVVEGVTLVDDEPVPVTMTIGPVATDSGDYSTGWGLRIMRTNVTSHTSLRTTGRLARTASFPTFSSGRVADLGDSISTVPYDALNKPFERHFTATLGVAQGNSNNIQSFFTTCSMGCWQVVFNPPLGKNDLQVMTIGWGYSWSRVE